MGQIQDCFYLMHTIFCRSTGGKFSEMEMACEEQYFRKLVCVCVRACVHLYEFEMCVVCK